MNKASLCVTLSIKKIFEILTFGFIFFTDISSMYKFQYAYHSFRSVSLTVQIKCLLFIKQFEQILPKFISRETILLIFQRDMLSKELQLTQEHICLIVVIRNEISSEIDQCFSEAVDMPEGLKHYI